MRRQWFPSRCSLSVDTSCSMNCSCVTTTDRFSPVCGPDRRTYFSACHAGCLRVGNGSVSGTPCRAADGEREREMGRATTGRGWCERRRAGERGSGKGGEGGNGERDWARAWEGEGQAREREREIQKQWHKIYAITPIILWHLHSCIIIPCVIWKRPDTALLCGNSLLLTLHLRRVRYSPSTSALVSGMTSHCPRCRQRRLCAV